MNVPEQIRTAARGLIEQYGESFLYDGSQATEVTGPSVFDFISLYVKDLDELEVE